MADQNVFLNNHDLGALKTTAFNDTYFYNLNRNIFDKISSQALYEAKFKNKLSDRHTLNIIIGTDSGLLPKYLCQKGLANGSRYIFVEPFATLQQLQKNQLLPESDPAIAYITLDEWQETIQLFKIQDYFYINAVQSFNAFCAEDDYTNSYAELSWHITEVLGQFHWNYSVSLGCEAFTIRQIANIADNLFPAKLLSKAFLGKTVVILAGGPSLDEALPWVQKHRQQLVVFAVSRISRQLKNINLEPDFIFSVDPSDLSFDISKEMLQFSSKPVFVYSYHTVPTLVNQWQGLGFYLGSRLPWKSKLNPDNLDGAGPTVTNTALSVANHLGFKRIILAGVDLCFTKEGYTHAKGSDEHKAGPRFNLTSLQTETNGGFMAPTSCDFASAINTLSAQAKVISATGAEIINPSVNAAKVANINHLPLSEIQLVEEAIDVGSVISKCVPKLQQDYQPVIAELRRVHFQVCAIKQLAETALKINQRMYSDSGHIGNYKDKRELDKIEQKLNRDYRQYSKLVKRFGIRHFIKITQPFADEDWSAEEAQKIGADYYQAYRDGATAIAKLLDGAIERITARIEETKIAPNFAVLFPQWRKDQSYGRAGIWRQKYPDIPADSSIATEFTELEQRFADILNKSDTQHLARAKSHTSFTLLKKRAALLFKHRKTEALQDALAGLLKHPEQEQAIPYVALINGYLAELHNDSDAAMQAYQAVIDHPDSPLLEDALLRIAGIGINSNDINNANVYLAFQCLAQIAPIYLPFYAEINRLRGDTLAAIDSYNEYIQQFPEDNLVQIKLATLYLDTQSYEAADMMVDYILAKDSKAQGAILLKKRLAELKVS